METDVYTYNVNLYKAHQLQGTWGGAWEHAQRLLTEAQQAAERGRMKVAHERLDLFREAMAELAAKL